MSKFEQLLDLIVNEEMDKANELFHEIVVEKSRDIYENLIAEEAEEEEMDEAADEDMDESADEEEMDESADEEEMDESADEEADESVDLEDSYSMEADDEEGMPGDEETGDFGGDIGATDDEKGGEGAEDSAIFDIKSAIEQLEAAFADLEAAQGGEAPHGEFDDEGDMDGEEEPMKMGFQEGRRVTREYREKVGNDWDKNSQKTQGQYLGAGTGEKDGAPVEGRSPISSGAGKPVGGKNVGAGNIVRNDTEGQSNTGDRPAKINKGINPESGEKFASGIHNVDGAKSGVKTLSAVKGGHGAEKKGASPGPVGSGSGDKAGQTSVPKVPQFLKPAN